MELLATIDQSPAQVETSVEACAQRHGYGPEQMRDTLLHLLHYPGYHLAYCFGAAWLDQRFAQQTPSEFSPGFTTGAIFTRAGDRSVVSSTALHAFASHVDMMEYNGLVIRHFVYKWA